MLDTPLACHSPAFAHIDDVQLYVSRASFWGFLRIVVCSIVVMASSTAIVPSAQRLQISWDAIHTMFDVTSWPQWVSKRERFLWHLDFPNTVRVVCGHVVIRSSGPWANARVVAANEGDLLLFPEGYLAMLGNRH